jgi:hypothetical protein
MSRSVDDEITNDESEKDEEFENLRIKSGGNASQHKKRFFDDVTFEHECKLTGLRFRENIFQNLKLSLFMLKTIQTS